MKSLPRSRFIFCIAIFLVFSTVQPVSALNTKTSFCKSMLADIKSLDLKGKSLFAKYSKEYISARNSNNLDNNLLQTRTLLELYENDRSIFLRALESKKCFTATEVLNLNESLINSSADTDSVKSWIDVGVGIPGKKFYSSYSELPRYITTPQAWSYCEKKSAKYKTLVCKIYEGKMRWIDGKTSESATATVSWPTDFIDGQVNLIEAKKRIVKYFEENSDASGTNGAATVEFMKRTSYPGLFNFGAEPMLTACNDFKVLQDNAGSLKIKYVVSQENIKPDPSWVIPDGFRGELIVNQKFDGQVFVVPVRIEFSQADWSDPGTFTYRHVTIINGIVYRFSAC